jgi:aryl-alcohol dehydrogenase-like predicted oxidoreductase
LEYRYLGSTGIKVSRLCFGTMSFGDQADAVMSGKLFNKAREAGINFFDCANSYAKGESEKILGGLIQNCRDELVVTSKVFNPMGNGVNDRGSSRRHITKAIDSSLLKLKTDYLDIYFLHQNDPATPLEETFSALNDLVHKGKIHYIGVSNFSAWQVEKSLGVCDKNGWQKIHCIQPMYNLVKRQAEVEILPMAKEEKLGVITYSPLGGGLLTGKYESGGSLNKGRLVENEQYGKRYGNKWMHESSKNFCDFAKKNGYHPASLAVAWVAFNDSVSAPIIGAGNPEQLQPSLDSLNIPMTKELYQEITAFTPTPSPATDRSESVS